MSSSVSATKITTKRGSHDDATAGKLTIYHYVMTPIIFVSFLVSLAWVDLRYSTRRSQHSEGPGRLPGWLRQVVYRRKDASGTSDRGHSSGGPQDGFYHSNQKKLAKMEMADAFEIRGTVVAVLFVLSALTSWGVWTTGCWAWGALMAGAIRGPV